MMASFPEELLIAFGMTDIDMSTILGFFGLIFLIIQICLAIQAANYGFSLVSVEETDLTADFLLAKPVGRTKIMTSKLLAAITGLTITNLVVWISSFARASSAAQHRGFSIVLPHGWDADFVVGEKGAKCNAIFDGVGVWIVCAECFWRNDRGGQAGNPVAF